MTKDPSSPEQNPVPDPAASNSATDPLEDALAAARKFGAEQNADAADPTDGLPEKMPEEGDLQPPDLDSLASEGAADVDAQAGEAGANPQAAEEQLEPAVMIEQLKAQLAISQSEHKDEILRMHAEMENQRKRSDQQVQKARLFGVEAIAKQLLDVKDSLEMGIEAARAEGADINQFLEGSDLTLKQLSQTFEKNNITEINPIDEKFNPEMHEAMTQQPVEGKEPNTVVNVIQKGYALNGRVIRAARVIVAK